MRAALLCAICGEDIDPSDECVHCGEAALLDGRYRLQEALGRGAAGTTYRATLGALGDEVAIKAIDVGKVENLKALELVDREIAALESIDHPGVPAYVDDFIVEKPGSVVIHLVQEYVDGQPLSELGRKFSEQEALGLVAELCETLDHLHNLAPPVIHRDIKPSNIIRRLDGSYALVDFGAVRREILDEIGGSTVAGTMGYMAPEQYRGVASAASDLYGVGATAVAMMAGRGAAELIDPLEPRQWQAEVDVSVETAMFLQTLLAPKVADRSNSAAEVAGRARGLLESDAGSERVGAADSGAAPEAASKASEVDVTAQVRERVERDLARDWRRYEVEDFLAGLDPLAGGATVLSAVMLVGVMFYMGTMALSAVFGFRMALALMAVALLVVAPIGLFVMWRFVAREIRWRGPFRQACMRGINDLDEAVERFNRTDDPWTPSPFKRAVGYVPVDHGLEAVIVAEEAARGHSRDENHFLAVQTLLSAQEHAEEHLAAGGVLHAVMKHRHAPMLYRSADHREQAVRDRLEADAVLQRAATATGLSVAEVVGRALREELGWGPESTGSSDDQQVKSIERRLWRRRIEWRLFGAFRHQVGASRSALVGWFIILSFLFGIVGSLVGLIGGLIFLDAPDESARQTVQLVAGGIGVVLSLVYVSAGWWLTVSRRRRGASWRAEWFTDLDEVWPGDHRLRGAFIEVADAAWDFQTKHKTLRELTHAAEADDLDAHQRSAVWELATIAHARGEYPYYDRIVEPLDKARQLGVRVPGSRIAALEAAADGLLRGDADNAWQLAREYMTRAGEIRAGTL
jgi:hypothetical protein